MPKVIPPSPNAAALQRYGDIPVSPYTGVPNISIPLYEIKCGDISVPISISYNASGIRVADEASRVGLGWVLNAGGMISRTVIGGDDFEYVTSYNNQTFFELPKIPRLDQGGNFNVKPFCNVDVNGYTLPSAIISDVSYDLQPDEYSYNFNGHSGKFVLTRNRDVVLNEIEKIDIKVLGSNATSWEIKTPDGTLYKFETFETYADYSGSASSHKSSWYLTKVVSPSGRSVDFVYSSYINYTHPVGSYFESKPGVNLEEGTRPAAPYPLDYISVAVSGKFYSNLVLSEISFDNGKVKFNYNNNRLDIEGDFDVSNIQIFSKDQNNPDRLLKTWNFNYSYFTGIASDAINSNASNDNLQKRLKLSSIQESNGSSQLPPYQFSYNNENDVPTSLPSKLSFGRDHWGYYNGRSNTSLIPSFQIGCASDPISANLGVMGTERNPNPLYNQLFTLSKITYPTGGRTEFEYETHDFDITKSQAHDHSYFANYLGNQSVYLSKNFSLSDGIQNGGNFTTNLDLTGMAPCSGSVVLEASFVKTSGGLQPAEINSIQYELTTSAGALQGGGSLGEFLGNTIPPKTEYLGQGQQSNSGVKLTLNKSLPPDIYTWKISVPASVHLNASDITTHFSKQEGYDPIINSGETVSNALFGGGLRIKRVIDYTSGSTVANIKKYTYHYDLLGKTYSYGKRMAKPNYSYFDVLSADANGVYVRSYVLTRESDSNIPLNGSAHGITVGYDKVQEWLGENGENGKTIYEYENEPDEIFNYSEYKPVLTITTLVPYKGPYGGAIANCGNGHLIKQTDYVNNGPNSFIPLKEIQNIYQDLIFPYDNAAVAGIERSMIKGSDPNLGACALINFIYPAVAQNRRILSSSSSTLYDITGVTSPLMTSTSFTYNNNTHLQLTSKSEFKSNGNQITTNYKYPADYTDAQSDAAIMLMKGNAYMHALPVMQQIILKTGANQFLKEASINKYQVMNSKIVQTEKALWEATQPLNVNAGSPAYNPASNLYPSGFVPRLFFDKFDGKNNIIQVHKSDDVIMKYIWDYVSSFPIAEVINAGSDSIVAYTSFEADGKGNWIFSGTPIIDYNPATGSKSYDLTSGNITKSGLAASQTYALTLWSRSGPQNVNGLSPTVTGINVNGWVFYKYKVTGATTVTISGSGVIDELRLYPIDALMSTYTYDPLIGMTSQCSANNDITYYEYDNFGRLKLIKDQNAKILKKYCYNYAGQTESCSLILGSVTPAVINSANVAGFTATYSNVNSGAQTVYNIVGNTLTVASGTTPLPAGNYTLTIAHATNTSSYIFGAGCGLTTNINPAKFYNIPVNANSCKQISIAPPLP